MKKAILLLVIVMLSTCVTITAWANDTVTLSGTVYLPEGEVAEVYTEVNICAKKVGESIITTEDDGVGTDIFTQIEEGQSSVSYSVELPKGNYILEVYVNGRAGKTLLGNFYYNSEKLSAYRNLSEPVKIFDNTVIDMKLPKATNTISGTVVLDKPAEEGEYIQIDSYTVFDTVNSDGFYGGVVYYLENGQTNVDFVLPAISGSTTIEAYYKEQHYTLKANGILSSSWDTVRYFDTSELSYDNVKAVLVSETNEIPENAVEVAMDLGEPADGWSYYVVRAYYTNDSWWAGAVEFEFYKGEQIKSGYMENPNGSYFLEIMNEVNGTVLYVGESGTATTNYADAKIFTADDTKIDIKFPEYINITGTIERKGAFIDNSVFVKVTFNSDMGESYIGEGFFDADSSNGTFTVKVPESVIGQAGTVFCNGDYWSSENVEITVGQSEEIVLALPENVTKKYDITFKLSEEASAGGVAVSIHSGGIINRYYIPAGQTTLDAVAEFFVSEYEQPYMMVTSEDLGFMQSRSIDLLENAENVIEINKTEYVMVSGTITVPKYVVGKGVSLQVYVGLSGDGIYTDISIPEGKTTGKYKVYVPKGSGLSVIYCRDFNSDINYYYEHNGDKYFDAIYLENDFVADIVAEDFAKSMVEDVIAGNVKFDWTTSYFFEDGSGLCSQFTCTNGSVNDYKPFVILAVYDENGKLVETQVDTEAKFWANGTKGHVSYFYTTINPNYTYKTMVFNNTYYLTPLLDAITAQ